MSSSCSRCSTSPGTGGSFNLGSSENTCSSPVHPQRLALCALRRQLNRLAPLPSCARLTPSLAGGGRPRRSGRTVPLACRSSGCEVALSETQRSREPPGANLPLSEPSTGMSEEVVVSADELTKVVVPGVMLEREAELAA